MSKPLLIATFLVSQLIPLQSAWSGNTNPDPAHVAATSEGFLYAHPDLRWRKHALRLYEDGKLDLALVALKRSARYADKGSQALVAEMYWNGEGATADHALAYVWMDLASERAYKDFLAIRERYWSQLSADERARALEIGQSIFAEFGDDVAKPRLARKINAGRRSTTGSRTGFKGSLKVLLPGNGSWVELDGEQYYNDTFWQPELYFEWQDQMWREPYRGRVEIGEMTREAHTNTPAKD